MNMGGVSLRRLRDAEEDYRLLGRWCAEEDVYRYFEQRILSAEEIRRKYYPRTLENAGVPVYMIEWETRPVGIIQYQPLGGECSKCCGVSAERGYEIDLFIGEAEARGRGVGQTAVRLMTRFLLRETAADILAMCPVKENVRAIRCYEKCGFEEAGRFSAPDTVGVMQEYVCMIYSRQKEKNAGCC